MHVIPSDTVLERTPIRGVSIEPPPAKMLWLPSPVFYVLQQVVVGSLEEG